MVGKIGNLIDGLRLVLSLARDDDLGALLAHLLENLVQTLLEKVGGVRAFRQFLFPALKQLIKPLQLELFALFSENRVVEAAFRPGVAGGAVLSHPHFQCVPVAVGGNGRDVLIIAAGLPLEPQLLPGAAPEAGKPLLQGDVQALPVHIGKGQEFPGFVVDDHCGNQTLFVKFQFLHIHIHNLTEISFSRRTAFSSGIFT